MNINTAKENVTFMGPQRAKLLNLIIQKVKSMQGSVNMAEDTKSQGVENNVARKSDGQVAHIFYFIGK